MIDKLLKLLIVSFFVMNTSYTQVDEIAFVKDRTAIINIEISGKSVSWISKKFNVLINKWTGEFEISIPYKTLHAENPNQNTNILAESFGESLLFKGTMPIKELYDQGESILAYNIECDVEFNGNYYKSIMEVNLFKMVPNGFATTAVVSFPNNVLCIEQETYCNDDQVHVFINLSGK